MKNRVLITNKIQCLFCFDIIESSYTHDFVECSCGSCFVDGGKAYQRRGFPANRKPEECYKELSEWQEVNM